MEPCFDFHDQLRADWKRSGPDRQVIGDIVLDLYINEDVTPYLEGFFSPMGELDGDCEYRLIEMVRYPDQDMTNTHAYLCKFDCTYHPTEAEYFERQQQEREDWEVSRAEYRQEKDHELCHY
tara:strand:+ start:2696 stop:3061 length:366 start_codon:yes stop_codon:yes gene_type:complete